MERVPNEIWNGKFQCGMMEAGQAKGIIPQANSMIP